MKKIVITIILGFSATLVMGQFVHDISLSGRKEGVTIKKKGNHILAGFTVSYDSLAVAMYRSSRRTLFLNVKLEYNKHNFIKKVTLDSVRYSEYGETPKKIYIDNTGISDPQKETIELGDSVYVKNSLIKEREKLGDTWRQADKSISVGSATLRSIYRSFNKPSRLYLELNYTPERAYRMLFTVVPMPDADVRSNLNNRATRENAVYGQTASLKVGYYTDYGRNRSVYLAHLWSQQGFRTTGHTVDWVTGNTNPGDDRLYRVDFWGFETGYSYHPYRTRSDVAFDAGVYFLWPCGSEWLRHFTWGSRLSLGLKQRISANIDLRLMPSLYINFMSLNNASAISTRFWGFGSQAGLHFFFVKKG